MDEQVILLGKDFPRYGELHCREIGATLSCALSVGSDKSSPALIFKGARDSTNEDALLIQQHGTQCFLAIADSHFGQWASHALLKGLSRHGRQLYRLDSISETLQRLCIDEFDDTQHSETTLLLASVELSNGAGFGLSFGDSTAMIIGNGTTHRLNTKNSRYVSLNKIDSFAPAIADHFTFRLQPNETLLVFSDGVDECHYGHPQTSITDTTILQLHDRGQPALNDFIKQLGQLALAGINGHPGGQDNIAIAALRY